MVKLNDTVGFSTFFRRFLQWSGEYDFILECFDRLEITGYCRCGQKDCATVYMRCPDGWEKEKCGAEAFWTNRGLMIIHCGEEGYLEFEALEYDGYHYKSEIVRLFRAKRSPFVCDTGWIDAYFDGLRRIDVPRSEADV